jgi:hypothetical protein
MMPAGAAAHFNRGGASGHNPHKARMNLKE